MNDIQTTACETICGARDTSKPDEGGMKQVGEWVSWGKSHDHPLHMIYRVRKDIGMAQARRSFILASNQSHRLPEPRLLKSVGR